MKRSINEIAGKLPSFLDITKDISDDDKTKKLKYFYDLLYDKMKDMYVFIVDNSTINRVYNMFMNDDIINPKNNIEYLYLFFYYHIKKNDMLNALRVSQDGADKGRKKYGIFNSYHEGYAVILEEMDELWDEVKKKAPNTDEIQEEAIHAAAMLLRFLRELCI